MFNLFYQINDKYIIFSQFDNIFQRNIDVTLTFCHQ